jgi:hypothetical protein
MAAKATASTPFLSSHPPEISFYTMRLKKELLLVSGFKQGEVDKLDLSSMEDEEFRRIARERLLGAMANNGNSQRVVPVGQVRDLIPQGWEYMAQLPTGEAIVKLP